MQKILTQKVLSQTREEKNIINDVGEKIEWKWMQGVWSFSF